MKILAVVVILLHIESTLGSVCGSTSIDRSGDRGVAENCSIRCLDWAKLNLDNVRFLSLANCGISHIVNISQNLELRELNLTNNKLQDLPHDLLQHLTSLNTLSLNENPLTAIPISVIQAISVTFDCSCGVLRDLIGNCREAVNCTKSLRDSLSCDVPNDGRVFNVSDFYNSECEGLSLIAVYVFVPLAIVIVGISVFVLMKLRSKRSTSHSVSPNKRQSDSSADHGQQRYVSATNWKDAATVSASPQCSREVPQQQLVHKDYENVLMGESDGAPGRCDRKQQAPDDTYYLESDPACDIYLNEQPIYCNYAGSVADPEDDVYIIPDK